ncbi:hypothetical protein [Halorarius litoreus]|uniref:hypothetical protein n=1 Tax=Halorarius litoreus TaxID=2962676 RepID=UPI0020CD8107|nr:hypothetical protein [Halorarius litoreus]
MTNTERYEDVPLAYGYDGDDLVAELWTVDIVREWEASPNYRVERTHRGSEVLA